MPERKGGASLDRTLANPTLAEGLDCLLFDCDGTLIDTQEIILESMRHTVNGLLGQSRSDDELMAGVGTPLEDQMRGFMDGADDEEVASIVAAYRAHNDSIHDAAVHAFPGVADGLAKLESAGYRMGVVTSKRHFLADRGLSICGIRRFFDVLIAPDDFPAHKPDPGPILEGCRLLAAMPQRTAYVGDSPYDIAAGNAAGCVTVAVLWGMFSRESLEVEHPTREATGFDDLVRMLVDRA